MITIRRLLDLDRLRVGCILKARVLDHLESYFRELHQFKGDGGTPLGTFSLDESGPIVILTEGDRPEDLQSVGMSIGLMGAVADFANCFA